MHRQQRPSSSVWDTRAVQFTESDHIRSVKPPPDTLIWPVSACCTRPRPPFHRFLLCFWVATECRHVHRHTRPSRVAIVSRTGLWTPLCAEPSHGPVSCTSEPSNLLWSRKSVFCCRFCHCQPPLPVFSITATTFHYRPPLPAFSVTGHRTCHPFSDMALPAYGYCGSVKVRP